MIEDLANPALLVSYAYLLGFLKNQSRYTYRHWVMDSGAFSAKNSGIDISLQNYIDHARELLQLDKTLTEVYALDVIGDWRASLTNTKEMWKQGVPAIPCFHYGEPWEVLQGLAKDYPKIAIGGCARKRGPEKDAFAGQCFARVWPKKVHGFGFGTRKSLMAFPWHSVDATSWELRPIGFGTWASLGHPVYGRAYLNVRGSTQNLRGEIEWHLELEREARKKWVKEMNQLKAQGPTVYLGLGFIRKASIPSFSTRSKK